MDIFLTLIFLCIYFGVASYAFYSVWFKFSELQTKLIERNEKYINGKRSFAYLSNLWLRHWTYKWFARIISSLLLFIGGIGIIASLYSLLSLVFEIY